MHVDGSMPGAYSTMSGMASSRTRRIAMNGTSLWAVEDEMVNGERNGERDYLARSFLLVLINRDSQRDKGSPPARTRAWMSLACLRCVIINLRPLR